MKTEYCSKCLSVVLLLSFLALLSAGCGAPRVGIDFKISDNVDGLDLGIPAVSLDVMVLSDEPEQKELPLKLESVEQRRAWFDERDKKMRALRRRLEQLEQLKSYDVPQNAPNIASVELQSPEQGGAFHVFVVIDVPNLKEPYARIRADQQLAFVVTLGNQSIEINPKSEN